MTAPAVRPAPAARYLLLGATVFLALGGLLMIFSASSASDFLKFGDSYYHVERQAIFLALGFVLLFAMSRVPMAVVRSLGWFVLIAADIGLLLVMVLGIGKFGAVRWIDLGFATVQPSEFAKLGCVLVIAGIMADRRLRPGSLKRDLVEGSFAVGIPFAFVMLQPDMGTAMSILLAVFFVVVLGGLPWRWIVGSVSGILVGVIPLILFAGYRKSRLLSFLDPSSDPQGAGYQILQARLAFGSGGVLGLGLGMSRQKFFYLPAAHTDFIFAIIGEELGLLGALAVVAAFGVMCYAGIRIAIAIKDEYARLVAGGLTIMIVTAAGINMASVTGLMPVTGIPLPLVSYGGTSLLFTMGCIGLILAMTRGTGQATKRRRPQGDDEEGSASARSGERRRNGRPRLSGIDGGRAGVSRRS